MCTQDDCLELLGCTKENALSSLRDIAGFLETHARRLGQHAFSCPLATIPIAACESERRGALTSATTRHTPITHHPLLDLLVGLLHRYAALTCHVDATDKALNANPNL